MIYAVYIIILIFLAIQYDVRNKNRTVIKNQYSQQINWKLPYWLMCGAFIFLAAFRDEIGGDTISYIRDWNNLPDLYNLSYNYLKESRYQFGFNYLFSAAKTIDENFVIFQIIHAVIVNGIIFWIVTKFTKYRFTTILLYFILNYLEFNTEILRESLAVCCGLIGYYCLVKKKYWWALISCLLAFCFHISAIILILIPFVSKIKYSKKLFYIFFIISGLMLIIFPLLPDITPLVSLISGDEKRIVEYYYIKTFDEGLNIKFFITQFFKCIIIPYFILKIIKNKNDQILGMALTYIILYIMSTYTYAFYRFANYFSVFYVMLFGEAIVLLIKKIKGIPFARSLSYIIIICLFIYLSQGYLLGISPTTGERLYARYFPYKSQFNEYVLGE